ncbi:hypothetical protein QC764_0095460 [Podospora pseudoanserina]|uniref:Uncharacterized protein n=1 Tax=Podospora pseudoanserina TaxID=2609844 RepID=A0ABR0HU27_9PEZI|nr:hypothetical protein QC764_0095460 [Podospora pseudoanserina]
MATMRLNNSLDLAARLWLMFGFEMEREGGFAWDGDKTLLDNSQQDPSIAIERMAKYLGILEKSSSESQRGQRSARVFAATFSPQHMMRLTSFHIVWTNDILEHLVVKVSKKGSHQATFFITQLC